MNKTIRGIGAAVLVTVWALLTGFAWFSPAKDISEAERRRLEKMPELSDKTIFDGSFMTDFESYTLDQFPLRDPFRQLKSLFHYYVLQQEDNNGIYIADGYAAKMEYPMNKTSVNNAVKRWEEIYDTYLKDSGSTVFLSIVPDKNYYLAEESGSLAMDYAALMQMVEEKTPWATHVDITDQLDISDYYYTDTHWRQEKILGVAQKLSQAMGLTVPQQEDYSVTEVERPFYGVYYGQAALPMESETIYTMNSELLSQCTVWNFETGKTTAVYDMEKLTSMDLYDVFLSGASAFLTIENPNAKTDRELVVFRDSFGSSLVPLLVADYQKVTLVDTRYIYPHMVFEPMQGKDAPLLEMNGQDVLFLYSTLVVNNSYSLKRMQ